MTRTPLAIAVPQDLGRRILDAARLATAIHAQSTNSAGGTGDETSTDGAAPAPAVVKSPRSKRRIGFGRFR